MTHKAHVQLIDDEPSILSALSLFLELEGYRVSVACNGKEGLAQVVAEQPDLVVTDCMMPHMDGVEVIRALRAQPALAAIPVILMSAAPLTDDMRAAQPDAYLAKPFGIDDILKALDRLLHPRRQP